MSYSRLTSLVVFAVALGATLQFETPARAGFFDHEVSAKPEHSASAPLALTEPSSIGASASISYQALTNVLSSALPKTFSTSGRQQVCADLTEAVQHTIQQRIGGDIGRLVGGAVSFVTRVVTVNQVRKVCQDVDYNVQVDRTSPVTISAGINKVHVVTNVTVTGQAGFSGDVAKALALDKKNFRGGIEASADIALDVDEKWCPKLQASVGYRWTDRAQLEIIHNVWLGIEGQVGDKLKDQLNSAVAKLQSSLSCSSVTNAVKNVWHPYSFPVAIPGVQGTAAYVNFTPVGAGFSGVSYGPSDLSLALSLTGKTEAGTGPLESNQAGDLPSLTRIPAATDKITIVLPVKIGYADASKALGDYLMGRDFEAETPAGHVKLNIRDVQLYPSAGKLAVVLGFAASTGHHILDTKGTVYLLATPSLDTEQQIVSFKDVSFTAITDNALWSTVVSVLNGPIKTLIEQKANYDLRPKISELRAKLTQLSAAAAKQNVALSLNQGAVGLRSIQLEEKTLTVVAGFDGKADLVVREITIPAIH